MLNHQKFRLSPIAFILLVSISQPVSAQSPTNWDPSGDPASWNDPSNWDAGIPSQNSLAVFDADDVSDGSTCLLTTQATIDSVRFVDNNTFTFANSLDVTIDGLDSGALIVDGAISLRALRKDVLVDFRNINVTANDLSVLTDNIGQFVGETSQLTLDDVNCATLDGFRVYVQTPSGASEAILNIQNSIFRALDENSVSTVEAQACLNTSQALIEGNVRLEDGEWNVNGSTTLQGSIGNDGGVVKLNGADLFIDLGEGNDGSVQGPIEGSGGMRFISGICFLAGANTFDGGLYIEGGEVWVTSGPSTGSGDNTISMSGGQMNIFSQFQTLIAPWQIDGPNSKVRVQDGGGLTLTNSLNGSGTLTKVETDGFLSLTGNNSNFSGEIVIEQGELRAGTGDSLGDNTRVTLGESGTFVALDVENFGSFGGSGLLDLSDGSIRLLDNTNQIFSGAIVGTATNSLTRRGTGSTTFSGDLSNCDGDLIVEESAMLELRDEAANTYPGTFEINPTTTGVVRALNTDVFSGPAVTNSGELELDTQQGKIINYSMNSIVSSGTITKKGFGELQLDGNLNAINGDLRILNGSLTGNCAVGADLSAELDSTIRPSSIIITTGCFILRENATLMINIAGTAPGSHAQIIAGDGASLFGNLNVELDPSFQLEGGQEFLILRTETSATVGTFNGLPEGATVERVGCIDLVISYEGGDGNDVVLTAVEGNLLGDVNRDCLVNLLDVGPLVELISNGDYQVEADINQDGQVNLLDVGPFVALLSGG